MKAKKPKPPPTARKKPNRARQRRDDRERSTSNKIARAEAKAAKLAKQLAEQQKAFEDARCMLPLKEGLALESQAIANGWVDVEAMQYKFCSVLNSIPDNPDVPVDLQLKAANIVVKIVAQKMEQERRDHGIPSELNLHQHGYSSTTAVGPTHPANEQDQRAEAIAAINRLAEEFGSPEVIPSDKDTGEQRNEAGSPLVESFDDHEESGPLAG